MLAAAALALAPWAVGALGATGDVADQAVAYLRASAPGLPATPTDYPGARGPRVLVEVEAVVSGSSSPSCPAPSRSFPSWALKRLL